MKGGTRILHKEIIQMSNFPWSFELRIRCDCAVKHTCLKTYFSSQSKKAFIETKLVKQPVFIFSYIDPPAFEKCVAFGVSFQWITQHKVARLCSELFGMSNNRSLLKCAHVGLLYHQHFYYVFAVACYSSANLGSVSCLNNVITDIYHKIRKSAAIRNFPTSSPSLFKT